MRVSEQQDVNAFKGRAMALHSSNCDGIVAFRTTHPESRGTSTCGPFHVRNPWPAQGDS